MANETGHKVDEVRRTVHLRVPGLVGTRTTRTPKYTCISKLPYGTWMFRFALMEEGRDDLKGRHFDWWFEKLKEIAAADGEDSTRPATRVLLHVVTRSGYDVTQVNYAGHLVRGDDKGPRLCSENHSLFEFQLDRVEVTEVWKIDNPPA